MSNDEDMHKTLESVPLHEVEDVLAEILTLEIPKADGDTLVLAIGIVDRLYNQGFRFRKLP